MPYRDLFQSGELEARRERAYRILESCSLCPRRCGVNRLEGQKGFCQVGREPLISSYSPHFGEEAPLVGRYGSGTIFLTRCNLACQFCQNYEISQLGRGQITSEKEIAGMMLQLQRSGCHNINFVTPTHFVPQILKALTIAAENGLSIPLVYNCGGYESVETLSLLEGIIDIYMPDTKYGGEEEGELFSRAPDYPQVMKAALREMHRQVGDLVIDGEGIAVRGLLVRHLVLPHGLAKTKEVMHFLAKEISPATYVNIMDQYRPCYHADRHPSLARPITLAEYREALNIAREEGLNRGFG